MMKKMLLLFLFLLPALSLSVRGATYGAQDRLEFSNARTEGHVILGLRL